MAPAATRDRSLLVAFLLSGAAALGYELMWTRLLGLALGSEALGVLGVLAGFFAGMAAGAVLFHGRARRSAAPVRLFAWLELVAAAYAVVSPHVLLFFARWLPPQLGPIAGDNDTPAALAISVAIAAVALLPATLCMGATLPALVEARRRIHPDEVDGRGVGRLYAANTLGATLGIVAAVHWILPIAGLAVGAVILAGIGVLSAFIALGWARRHRVPALAVKREPLAVVEVHRDPDPDVLREPWLLHLLIFGTGLVGIGLEVVGVHVMAQILEDTVYTFADILAVYLLGTAVGSWLYGRHARQAIHGRPATATVVLLMVVALATVIAGAVLAGTPTLMNLLAPRGSPYVQHLVAEGFTAALVFLPPTLVMGALFSHLVGLLAPNGVGRAYALNTLGSAAAPFVFGLWMIPTYGYTDSFFAVAFAYLFLMGGFMWFRRFKPRWIVAAMGAVVVPFFLLSALIGPNALVLVTTDDDWRLLDRRETFLGLVMVTELKTASAAEAPRHRRLQVGKMFRMGGSTGFAERRMGHLPLLLAPSIERALFLGVGTGATLGAVRHHPVRHVEAVELVPAVLDMLPHFQGINEGIADEPKVEFHSADARRYLAASPHRYDVIVGDLFHPARDGAGSLYALEHFQNARDHLASGGTFVQWLPLYQLEPDSLQAIVRTFVAVFPEVHSFLGIYNAATPCLALIGRASTPDEALAIDPQALQARLQEPIFAELLLNDARDVFAGYMLDREALVEFAGDGPLNTDLFPYVLFNTPRGDYIDDPERQWNSLLSLLSHRVPVPPSLIEATPTRDSFLAAVERLSQALGAYLRGDVARAAAPPSEGMPMEALEHYLHAYRLAPEFVPARGMLYQSARQDQRAAELIYPRMLEITPQDERVYQEYLGYLRGIGDEERFDDVRAQAQRRFPQPASPATDEAAATPAP